MSHPVAEIISQKYLINKHECVLPYDISLLLNLWYYKIYRFICTIEERDKITTFAVSFARFRQKRRGSKGTLATNFMQKIRNTGLATLKFSDAREIRTPYLFSSLYEKIRHTRLVAGGTLFFFKLNFSSLFFLINI